MQKSEKAALLVYTMPIVSIAILEFIMWFFIKPWIWEQAPEAVSLWQFDLLGAGVIIALWYPIRKRLYEMLMID